mmetsp:Transcript_15252/g.32750  ORF Transcript_15252/g.32750 Transcript_15252/m.32750 type:complete len:206 (-) Transcript_15252:1253-1870(-)
MLRPSLIMRWIRAAKIFGSSSENPDVSSAVSNSKLTKSFTVLSLLSASTRVRNSFTIAFPGLISIVFREDMYIERDESRSACAFMMRSMFADQPYSPVTRMHGESDKRSETTTFSTFSPRMSFMIVHRLSNDAFSSSRFFFSSSVSSISIPSFEQHTSFFPSYSFSCCTQYSSMGSTIKMTSKPFCFSFSRNGLFCTEFLLSPVM